MHILILIIPYILSMLDYSLCFSTCPHTSLPNKRYFLNLILPRAYGTCGSVAAQHTPVKEDLLGATAGATEATEATPASPSHLNQREDRTSGRALAADASDFASSSLTYDLVSLSAGRDPAGAVQSVRRQSPP